ncbi:MAG: ABC transporter ATP-binding protein/permease [Myxococcota bacterium]|nr:ABC transporter ATP-binding protein/permease [Myxococcota bacterium]
MTTAGAGPACIAGAGLTALFAGRSFLQQRLVSRVESRLYVQVVEAVLRKDALLSSILPDEEARLALFEGAHTVAGLVGERLPSLVANVLAAVVLAAYVLSREPALVTALGAVALVLGGFSFVFATDWAKRAQGRFAAAWGRLADGVSDAFEGRLEIIAGGQADAHASRFAGVAEAWRRARLRVVAAAGFTARAPLVLLAASIGAALVIGGLAHGRGRDEVLYEGALLASMAPPFIAIGQAFQDFFRSDWRIQRVGALLDFQGLPARPGKKRPRDVKSVELRDIHFSYEQPGRSVMALRGVSFTWKAGEILAIAGSNGSGKSTCLRVILGLGPKPEGDVLIDGVPMEQLDVEHWRHRVAFLPQRPYLPPRTTVRECLRFVDINVPDEVMLGALERTGLAKMLSGDIAPLDRRVDELSAGQRQRVGVARVLCRPDAHVVLDEPDGNLDEAGTHLLAELLRELVRTRMVIVVAHSAALLAAADRVITLEDGIVRANVRRESISA